MALETLWIAWKRHQHRLGYVLIGVLLFAAGWQLGRTTSPYYAASPIVFQEAPGVAADANNGSPEALVALRDAGLKKETASAQVAAATTVSPIPVGEGTATSSTSPLPPPQTPPQTGGETNAKMFAGSKNSNLYHHKDCPSVSSIKEENIIWWPSKEAAEAAGYKPSKCTEEKLSNTN